MIIAARAGAQLSHRYKLGLTLSLFLSAAMWFYLYRMLPVASDAGSDSANRTRVLGDLYPRWFGTRELLLHHRDPYSPEVSRETLTAYYGSDYDPTRPGQKDEQRFAYPLYVVFLLAPTTGMSFENVQTLFRWLLAVVTAISVPLWMRATGLRISLPALAMSLPLVLISIPVAQGLGLQQLALLAASLTAASAALLAGGYGFLAGALLALATIKPQLVMLLMVWLLVWVGSDWRRRQPLFWGFTATLTALVLGAEYLSPGWVTRFINGAIAYRRYAGGASFLSLLLPNAWSLTLTACVLLVTMVVCWKRRRDAADSASFAVAHAMVLAATVLLVPAVLSPFNYIVLLPAMLLSVRGWNGLRGQGRLSRVAMSLLAIVVISPWLLSWALVCGRLLLGARFSGGVLAAPQFATLGLPLAAFAMLVFLRVSFRPAHPPSRREAIVSAKT